MTARAALSLALAAALASCAPSLSFAGGAADAVIPAARRDCASCHAEIFPVRPKPSRLPGPALAGAFPRRGFAGWERRALPVPPGAPELAVYTRAHGAVRRFYAMEGRGRAAARFFLPAPPGLPDPHRLDAPGEEPPGKGRAPGGRS